MTYIPETRQKWLHLVAAMRIADLPDPKECRRIFHGLSSKIRTAPNVSCAILYELVEIENNLLRLGLLEQEIMNLLNLLGELLGFDEEPRE